jgi:hypothetical protein
LTVLKNPIANSQDSPILPLEQDSVPNKNRTALVLRMPCPKKSVEDSARIWRGTTIGDYPAECGSSIYRRNLVIQPLGLSDGITGRRHIAPKIDLIA